MAEPPLFSIIITSYTTERLKDVFPLLDSVNAQTYSNLETIFVAERSVELLNEVRSYATKNNSLNLKVLFNNGETGLSAARNLGIKEAKGDIIAFVDDDTILAPDWTEEMVKAYEDNSTIGITGASLPLWEDESMAWFPKEFYWLLSCTGWCNWDDKTEVRNAWGQGMSFRKEAFEECGPFLNEYGYHKGPMAEDNEFSLRVRAQTGKRILYSPQVRLWHRVYKYRLSHKFIRERALWIGYSRRMMKRLYPKSVNDSDPLSQEHQLLKQVFTSLFPSIIKSSFISPIVAWRKLRVTLTALTFVTLGYYFYLIPTLSNRGNSRQNS